MNSGRQRYLGTTEACAPAPSRPPSTAKTASLKTEQPMEDAMAIVAAPGCREFDLSSIRPLWPARRRAARWWHSCWVTPRSVPATPRDLNAARRVQAIRPSRRRRDDDVADPLEQKSLAPRSFEALWDFSASGPKACGASSQKLSSEPISVAAVVGLMHIGCAVSHVVASGRRPASWPTKPLGDEERKGGRN
jgi:hypothetical protein